VVPALERYFEDYGWVLDAKEDYLIEPILDLDSFEFKQLEKGF
jgi:hypothetical protein